ncbi:MAG: 4-(cytidine 5'-diphospho)-2-C-methyl-D-erythritol kinase [Firmicutes bacterium]|nr:4-(cytidine 5'-diphospho)-2-C-methyl-D-erythritol kinase [Bacillota bacterium]
MTVAAPAKINLSLDVRGRRPDGYHELDTVFQSLALHDTVILRPARTGIEVVCDSREIPCGPQNLAYRAAAVGQKIYGVDHGVHIILQKRIPVGAGMGGGSADAAAVLQALPTLWGLPALPEERLHALARELGADVPFCLLGGTARGRGIGDLLEPLPPLTGLEVLLVKPAVCLSTAEVYARLDPARIVHPEMGAIVEAICRRDLLTLGRLAGNVLEAPAREMAPEIEEIKAALRAAGAAVALMTGSGPTVFGLAEEPGWALRVAEGLHKPGWTVIATKT